MSVITKLVSNKISAIEAEKCKKIRATIGSDADEQFEIRHFGREIHFKASNPRSAFTGLNHLAEGLESPFPKEFTGTFKAHFPLRPLLIECGFPCIIDDNLSIWMADYTLEQWEKICQRLLQLGYNSLMLTNQFKTEDKPRQGDWKAVFQILQQYGIQVIVEPKIAKLDRLSILDPAYPTILKKALSTLEQYGGYFFGFFWEGKALRSETIEDPSAKNFLLRELRELEIKHIQQAIKGKKLFYYLFVDSLEQAEEEAKRLPTLCQNIDLNTIFLFSAVAGAACQNHLPINPIWKLLRKNREIPTSQLMALLNVGAMNMGEGCWPVFNADVMSHHFFQCHSHQLYGAVALARTIPKPGTFLDGLLWAHGKMQWRLQSENFWLQSWFELHHPELQFSHLEKVLKRMSCMTNEAKSLAGEGRSPNESRTKGEAILAELKHLQELFERERGWYDYFQVFQRDIKLILQGNNHRAHREHREDLISS